MISLAMSVVGMPEHRFYSEIKPISEKFDPKALAISGLDRTELLKNAPSAQDAMRAADSWVNSLRKIGRPVFLAGPADWDGMFIHWSFINFLGKSPFGNTGSGIDLRSYWMA